MFKNIQSYVFLVLMALCILLSGPISGNCKTNDEPAHPEPSFESLPSSSIWKDVNDLITDIVIWEMVTSLHEEFKVQGKETRVNQFMHRDGVRGIISTTLQKILGVMVPDMVNMYEDYVREALRNIHKDPATLNKFFLERRELVLKEIKKINNPEFTEWIKTSIKELMVLYGLNPDQYLEEMQKASKKKSRKLSPNDLKSTGKYVGQVCIFGDNFKPCDLAEKYRQLMFYGWSYSEKESIYDVLKDINTTLGVSTATVKTFGMIERRVAIDGGCEIEIRTIYMTHAIWLLDKLSVEDKK